MQGFEFLREKCKVKPSVFLLNTSLEAVATICNDWQKIKKSKEKISALSTRGGT